MVEEKQEKGFDFFFFQQHSVFFDSFFILYYVFCFAIAFNSQLNNPGKMIINNRKQPIELNNKKKIKVFTTKSQHPVWNLYQHIFRQMAKIYIQTIIHISVL